jgi:Cu-Zn family superoxide dismutase
MTMGEHLHVAIAVRGMATGTYGTHLHAVGQCEGPAFASAGGHLNPGGHQHGRLNPMGTHMGDLPNLVVDAAGRGVMDFELSATTASLLDADGTAIVIHAGADDERTDPSGNSGARIACAVLSPGG